MSWNDDLEKLNAMIEKREGVFQSDHITHEDGEQALLQIDPRAFPQKIKLLLNSTPMLARVPGGWRINPSVSTMEQMAIPTTVQKVQAMVDWKMKPFDRDVLRVTDAIETVSTLFGYDVSTVRMGLLLREIPGAMKLRAYDKRKGQVWVWVIRNAERYQTMSSSELWRFYHGA